jgi:hypothetical protein
MSNVQKCLQGAIFRGAIFQGLTQVSILFLQTRKDVNSHGKGCQLVNFVPASHVSVKGADPGRANTGIRYLYLAA